MNYGRVYKEIIESAIIRDYRSTKYRIGSNTASLYTEVHHIIPKCMGGNDSKSNLAVLTAKEHYIVHHLLCKIFPNSSGLILAFRIMLNRTKDKKSRNYVIYKKLFADNLSKTQIDFWTEERKKIKSIQMKDKYKCPLLRQQLKNQSNNFYQNNPEAREIVSENSKINWSNSEYVLKHKIAMDKVHTDPEYLNKISKLRLDEMENNPVLREKRVAAIHNHMHNKSPEWVKKITEINKKRMNTPEQILISKNKYKTSNFNNSKKVIDTLNNVVYDSIKSAADSNCINYNTLKVYIYKNKGNFKFYKETE